LLGSKTHDREGRRSLRPGPEERDLLWDLAGDLRMIPATGWGLFVLAVVGVLALFEVLPLEPSTQESIAATIGLFATLLAVAVTLAIFRWTQSDSARTRRDFADIKESVEELEAKFAPADEATEEALQADGAVEDDDADIVPPTPGKAISLHDRTYQVAEAQANSARWWADLLGRVRDVADSGGEHSQAAQHLLSLPLAAFQLTATLDTQSRGNRRTLIITADDGQERIWSVFSGKGKHVIDVTGQVD